MKSPFASLNWGVYSPSPYIFTVSLNGASGGDSSDSVYLWSHPTQVYTDFASAFENLFQRAAGQMDNRVEWFFENSNAEDMSFEEITDEIGMPLNEPPTIFDLQGFYNEAPRRAKIIIYSYNSSTGVISGTELQGEEQVTFRRVCNQVWTRLSEITQFHSWQDYQSILRRRVSESERERLNQAFVAFIELIPPMNLWKAIEFRSEFDDDYYSSQVNATLEILPRNLEGRK